MLIKICGITSPEIAVQCFEAGVDMIGLVHYPPSPRHVDAMKIREILDALAFYRNKGGKVVLVAVDFLPEDVISRFDYVQCYGNIREDIPCCMIPVIKDRIRYDELMSESEKTGRDVLYALEMSQGILPGGNGASWSWFEAKPFCARYSTLLAGGITPENVLDAIFQAKPYGIDVSSGIESAPGIKDMAKVRRLIETVRQYQFQGEKIK